MTTVKHVHLNNTDVCAFSPVLAGGYLESSISSLDTTFPEERDDFTDEYEYFSDSDLDDEEYSEDDKTSGMYRENVNYVKIDGPASTLTVGVSVFLLIKLLVAHT